MPKKGEYVVSAAPESSAMSSHPRLYGVMFNPSSSRSRFRVIDSGRRYEIRVNAAGFVEFSVDGINWRPIEPHPDPCTGELPPGHISYNRLRAGEELKAVSFDTIAVGRGRILAKEAGTDRMFHLVMDELFRTHEVHGNDCNLSAGDSGRTEDPPVPAGYWKLDPEFFVAGPTGNPVPPELDRDYARHPASIRFRVFREVLQLEIADAMLVLQRPRVWYLIDVRSPLMITGPEDLRINESAFKAEFAGNNGLERLKAIMRASYSDVKQKVEDSLRSMLESLTGGFWTRRRIRLLGAAIGGGLGAVIGGIAGGAIGGPIGALGGAVLGAIGGAIVGSYVVPYIVSTLVPWIINSIVDGLAELVIAALAARTQASIQAEGFGALVLPGNIGLLWGLYKLREGPLGGRALDTVGTSLALHPQKVANKLTEAFPDNKPLSEVLARLMLQARGGNPIPNAPPLGVPTQTNVQYERSKDGDIQRRVAIQYSKVLDLGVGYSHWSEQWEKSFGTEMNNLLATRPMAQQEQYNLLQYRLLNGPVIDGDGYNDGTCNFYMLVKLGNAREDRYGYAILWMDEQSYITQRWRLLHPADDVRGDWFSLARVLRDNIDHKKDWFRFDQERYWSPFLENSISDASRMLVRRQLIVLTGYSESDKRHEIYTICFNYGVCDHSWRWREFPKGAVQKLLQQHEIAEKPKPLSYQTLHAPQPEDVVYVNSLELRDDLTLHVRGYKYRNDTQELQEGRWFQHYLSADCRHVPRPYELSVGRKPARGFSHEWDFFSEQAYQGADQFYQFGVYEDQIDSRCQYYKIDLLQNDPNVIERPEDIVGRVWRSDPKCSDDALSINTEDANLWFEKLNNGYIPVTKTNLTNERRFLSMSMYEPTSRFRILERRPLGLIMVYFDKRDDDLQPASHLPRPTHLCLDGIEDDILPEWDDELDRSQAECSTPGETHRKPLRGSDEDVQFRSRAIHVLVKSNKRVMQGPIVVKARAVRELSQKVPVGLVLSFWTPQTEDEVYENIWAVRLAALSESRPVMIFESEVFAKFVRQGVPDEPLRLDWHGELGPTYCYQYHWHGFGRESADLISKFCSRQGRNEYGTSIWFEDIVGHRRTAQCVEFVDVER